MAFLEINKNSINSNAQLLSSFCTKHEIRLCVATKCCYSEEGIVTILHDSGINEIADSNQENFHKLPANLSGNFRKSVIKTRLTDILTIPSLAPHERPQRVFISDEVLLNALAELPCDICPDVMLVIEIGDLRDGFYPQEIPSILKKYHDLPISGISANYACLSGKMPCIKSACLLTRIASEIKTKNREPPLVSLGGTVAYSLFYEGAFKNNSSHAWELRCGEGIFLGYDSSSGKELPGFKQDTFKLFGEIMEVREKEYFIENNKGLNAMGEHCITSKSGKRLNIVLDFGVLVASAKNLKPLDISSQFAGQTFDFTVVDITESGLQYKTGQYIGFAPSYGAMTQAMLNKYVKKVYK